MRRIIIVLLLVALAIVLLMLFAGGRLNMFAKKQGKQTVDVVLTEQGGVCKANSVDRLGNYYKKKITWHITNNCQSPQYVAMRNYIPYVNGAPTPPSEHVVDPDPAYSGLVAAGASVDVEGKIDKLYLNMTGDDLVFKYSVCVAATPQPSTTSTICLDPDVDVWPGFNLF